MKGKKKKEKKEGERRTTKRVQRDSCYTEEKEKKRNREEETEEDGGEEEEGGEGVAASETVEKEECVCEASCSGDAGSVEAWVAGGMYRGSSATRQVGVAGASYCCKLLYIYIAR